MPWELTGNARTNPNTNFIGTTDQKALVVKTNNKEALRVDSNGSVGIGTPTPQGQLHVGPGSSSIDPNLVNVVVASGNPESGIAIAQKSGVNVMLQASPVAGFLGTTSDHPVMLGARGIGRIFVDTTGKVGVGTPTPQNLLHVGGGSSSIDASRVNAVIAGGNPDGGIAIAQNSGTNLLLQASSDFGILGTTSGHPLVFKTGDQGRVVIDTDGNMRIGDADFGSSKLGVAGIMSLAGLGGIIVIDPDGAEIQFFPPGGGGLSIGPDAIGSFSQIAINAAQGLTINSDLAVTGHARFQGGKEGFLVDQFINGSQTVLKRGDVVCLRKTEAKERSAERIPVPEVELACEAYATGVCGIVDGAVPKAGHRFGDPVSSQVPPSGRGLMVTIGCYAACNVDADVAAIKPGDLLTASPTPGHAQKIIDRSQAVGAILGKALKAVETGKATIPILVLLH